MSRANSKKTYHFLQKSSHSLTKSVKDPESEDLKIDGFRLIIFDLLQQEDQSLDLVMIERIDLPVPNHQSNGKR